MKLNTILSLIIIIALVTAVFFVFGIHQIRSYLCPINTATGICGFLGSLTQVIDHIFSLNVFLVLVLPVIASFIILLNFYLLVTFAFELPSAFSYLKRLPAPKVKIGESRWLKFHINSPPTL